MILFQTGNLLDSEAEALVNTVNTVGVMGKGIALQFKEKFPENYRLYRLAAQRGEVQTGKMFVVKEQTIFGKKIIINFPTKEHWSKPSQYVWIEEGLNDLIKIIQTHNIQSIAIPPLGCGNGKLEWSRVQSMIEQAFEGLEKVKVHLYAPNSEIRTQLKDSNPSKTVKLTPARAEILFLLFHYEASGEESSLFIANKLAYFLQRLGEKQLNLRFTPHFYGPYSNQVDHLMYALNGGFIQGLEQRTAKAFDRLFLRYDRFEEVNQYISQQLSRQQQERLYLLLDLIEGFRSPLSMEALATVDLTLQKNPEASEMEIFEKVGEWSKRKKKLFTLHHISVAYKRIKNYQSFLA